MADFLDEEKEREARFLNKVKEGDERFLNKIREANKVFPLEQDPYQTQPADETKKAALDKMAGNPNNFHNREPLGFTNLNRRQFGPYELDTVLNADSSQDDKEKFAKLSHLIRFKGGQHSPEQAQKLANELRDINKPIDPALVKEITSLPEWKTQGDTEYIKNINRQAKNGLLWNK